jgi:endogenous inhibitor of DNA gyrase (YacG/DUF329 family)
MAKVRCPTCSESFDTEITVAMPFCSERCRIIDMGKWLDEEVGIPLDEEDKADLQLKIIHRRDDDDDDNG